MNITAEGFKGLNLKSRYSTGSDDPLHDFYVPVLKRAFSYDRIAGYFASSAFISAAAGLACFINNVGTIRLIVGAQLSEYDRHALQGQASLDDVLTRSLSFSAIEADQVARQHVEVLAWLVRERRLQLRVCVPSNLLPDTTDATNGNVHPQAITHDGYFHVKVGVLTDGVGDKIAFSGSVNETAAGWQKNYEDFSVYSSWKAESWNDHAVGRLAEFERLWRGELVAGWRSVDLPEAVEHNLLKLIPPDEDWKPPNPYEQPETPTCQPLSDDDLAAIERIRQAPTTSTGVGLLSAGITPWPHQLNIARRICDTWPRSYLLADEVGLGKTIEAGLVIRELMLAGKVTTALILVPASVLIQWQQELAEKFLLDIPRLVGDKLVFNDGRSRKLAADEDRWRASPLLLASSHLARRRAHRKVLCSGDQKWDLILVDEAHHARRRGHKPNGTPNEMLATLLDLRKHRMYRALLLASATPMQMHTHDLWDLLALFGLPPRWRDNADVMREYYEQLHEPFAARDWNLLRYMVAGHFADPKAVTDPELVEEVKSELGFAGASRLRDFHENGLPTPRNLPADQRPYWNRWLRANTPVADRVFRTTRKTLRSYSREGILASNTVIPTRQIVDRRFGLGQAASAYQHIDDYIKGHYDRYLEGGSTTKPLGFIMAIYRRRLTSSFHAIKRSLQRRRAALTQARAGLAALLDDDDRGTLEGSFADLDPLARLDDTASRGIDVGRLLAGQDLEVEISALDSLIEELASLPPVEPKMEGLGQVIEAATTGGETSAVVFTQYADTLRYIRSQLRHVYGKRIACYHGGAGEVWDSNTQDWVKVSKEHVKHRFRSGEIRVLIGTDSMSEGLNLQTCSVLVNFDLPWNFARVEQRIGRLDRINGRRKVRVFNLFYEGTVEDDIYSRLRERHDWFGAVLGAVAPVLATTDDLIRDAAMGRRSANSVVEQIEDDMGAIHNAPVNLDHIDSVPTFRNDLQPAMTLKDLQDTLFGIPAAHACFSQHQDDSRVWELRFGRERVFVTFDADCYDNSEVENLQLLTWANPTLNQFLNFLQP